MLELFFSFRGRINRIQYLTGCIGLAGVVIIAMLVCLAGAIGGRADPKPAIGVIILIAIAVAPGLLWASFAMQAKRFRDIGWNPVYVIPGWIVIGVIDTLVALGAPALAVDQHHTHTLVGGLVNLALGGSLLFWPGRPEGDAPPDTEREWSRPIEPPPPAPTAPARRAPPAPTPAPAPAWSPAPQPTGFGRRGL
jgi:uncharacterized membrane protein YhaH (DUF805 family)